MSTFLKRLRLYVKNAQAPTLNKHLLLEEFQQSSPDKENPGSSPSLSSNVQNVGTSTENLSQRKYNLLTDSHPGLHNYD